MGSIDSDIANDYDIGKIKDTFLTGGQNDIFAKGGC
jgi:hypothetical protein